MVKTCLYRLRIKQGHGYRLVCIRTSTTRLRFIILEERKPGQVQIADLGLWIRAGTSELFWALQTRVLALLKVKTHLQ